MGFVTDYYDPLSLYFKYETLHSFSLLFKFRGKNYHTDAKYSTVCVDHLGLLTILMKISKKLNI